MQTEISKPSQSCGPMYIHFSHIIFGDLMIIINALTLPRKCNKNVTKVETNLLILCFTNIKQKMKQYFKEVSRDWAIF